MSFYLFNNKYLLKLSEIVSATISDFDDNLLFIRVKADKDQYLTYSVTYSSSDDLKKELNEVTKLLNEKGGPNVF